MTRGEQKKGGLGPWGTGRPQATRKLLHACVHHAGPAARRPAEAKSNAANSSGQLHLQAGQFRRPFVAVHPAMCATVYAPFQGSTPSCAPLYRRLQEVHPALCATVLPPQESYSESHLTCIPRVASGSLCPTLCTPSTTTASPRRTCQDNVRHLHEVGQRVHAARRFGVEEHKHRVGVTVGVGKVMHHSCRAQSGCRDRNRYMECRGLAGWRVQAGVLQWALEVAERSCLAQWSGYELRWRAWDMGRGPGVGSKRAWAAEGPRRSGQ